MNVRWLNNIFSINAILLLMLFFTACEEKPAALPGDYSDMPLYADFRISGDEEGGKITVLLQFRAGAVDGPGVALEAPAAIYFDGQELHAWCFL